MTDIPELDPYLAERSVLDLAFYEWLLYDHPIAVPERTRRQAVHIAHEAVEIQTLRAWVTQMKAAREGDELYQQLATICDDLLDGRLSWLAAQASERDELRTARLQRELEATQRASQVDPGYAYPERYLGTAAAHQPIPPRSARSRRHH